MNFSLCQQSRAFLVLFLAVLTPGATGGQRCRGAEEAPIDRHALVSRHNVELTRSEPVQVGNGEFAFSADLTGLQTFEKYSTMSHWGWHSSPLPPGVRLQDFKWTEQTVAGGRRVPFAIGNGDALSRYLEGNPHRINLGRIGLRLTRPDGKAATLEDIGNPRQTLDLWNGLLTSRFEVSGQPVQVETSCHPELDLVAVRVRSPLIAAGRLRVELAFPYPDLNPSGGFGEMKNAAAHQTRVSPRGGNRADFQHSIDATTYHVSLGWSGAGGGVRDLGADTPKPRSLVVTKAEFGANTTWADVRDRLATAVRDNRLAVRADSALTGGNDPVPGVPKTLRVTYALDGVERREEIGEGDFLVVPDESNRHRYLLSPAPADSLEFTCAFSPKPLPETLPGVEATMAACREHWPAFWNSGGAIDLSGSRDPRWKELERRIVLSQYLLAVNEAGSLPPAEGGLVFNGWYGRFHWEMFWWHGAHYALWDRWPLLRRSLGVYRTLLPAARNLARFQGYAGARWPKCTGPDGSEWPNRINAMLIWQQPHPIFFAELDYRAHPTRETLERWREIVADTADFMESFTYLDPATGRRVLGPPIYAVAENTEPENTLNPTFELAYWRFGLRLAQTWRERLGLPRKPGYDAVLRTLAPLPVEDGRYVLHEGIRDMWTKWNWEHPALIGALGWLPPGDGVDAATMRRTFAKVMETWQFGRMWGWDYPMLAMCAARLGEPANAVDLLLRPTYQFAATGLSGGPPPYFPSNGGLLYAAAFLAAGWDGAPKRHAPGFPDDGSWTVRWEGLRPAP